MSRRIVETMADNPIIVIPARMASTRLPGKPLADINGKPMIVRVAEQARAAGAGRVVVATDAPEILTVLGAAGGEAVMTDSGHASGSDRVAEAVRTLDPDGRHDVVVNVQGDLPTLDPNALSACIALLAEPQTDIATLGCEITDLGERDDPNVVKIVGTPLKPNTLRALYFTRATAPYGEGPLYHHIGIYAFRRAALERFVGLPPSSLETRERLEQLRALEAGMRIDAAIVDWSAIGVDTPGDLERVRRLGEEN